MMQSYQDFLVWLLGPLRKGWRNKPKKGAKGTKGVDRRLQIESLEQRKLLTATLYWYPSGESTVVSTSAANWNSLPDGSGTQTGWVEMDNAVFNQASGNTLSVEGAFLTQSVSFDTTSTLTVASSSFLAAFGTSYNSAGLTVSGNGELDIDGVLNNPSPLTVTGGQLNNAGELNNVDRQRRSAG